MDWAELSDILIGLIAALGGAIAIPLVLKKRKKDAPAKVERLFRHLQELGIRISLMERGAEQAKVGVSRAWGQRSEGVIKLEGENVDYINVSSVSSQYGVNYFLDFLVKSSGSQSAVKMKKTKMVRKKGVGGRMVNIQWKGDEYLCQSLNYDYRLQDLLMQAKPEEMKGGVSIIPEPKHEYARIRTAYFLPSSEFIEAIHGVAGHVKSAW